MRPRPVEIKCESVHDLQSHFSSIQQDLSLSETEETWEKLSNAISCLNLLSRNGAAQFPSQLISSLRSISRPLITSLYSERSRLSGITLELLSSLATMLEFSFNPLLPIFLPPLLNLCTRTNKVFCARARMCIMDIIEHTRLPNIFSYLVDALKDKSISLRLTAAEAALVCLNKLDPPELSKETRAREIEFVIRCTIKDASADIRNVSRKIFDAYNILVPERVDAFVDPLTPTAKKYLNIKPKAVIKPSGLSGAIRKTDQRALQHTTSGSQQQQARGLKTKQSQSCSLSTKPISRTENRLVLSKDPSSHSGATPALLPSIDARRADDTVPRAGPARCPVILNQPTVVPVRLSKRSDPKSSNSNGVVRLLNTLNGTKSTEGPRRVTIVPMPPQSKEIRVQIAASRPTKQVSKASTSRSIGSKPPTSTRLGQHSKTSSAINELRSKPMVESGGQRLKSTSAHASGRVGQMSGDQAASRIGSSSNKPSKNISQARVQKIAIPPSDTVEAAVIPLPQSPLVSVPTDGANSIASVTADEPLDSSAKPQESMNGPRDAKNDQLLSAVKSSKIQQTPISALVTSIERGFRFPDYPPLPALAMVEEVEDVSFDIPEVRQIEIKALKIQSKSSSRDETELGRPALVDMPLNR